MILLHFLLWAFELDLIKHYTIDFFRRRHLVTSRRFRFLPLRKSRMRLSNSIVPCFFTSMLAFLLSASFDHWWMFVKRLRSRRCLRPISRHMAHVFGTLVVEWIERIPQDSPVITVFPDALFFGMTSSPVLTFEYVVLILTRPWESLGHQWFVNQCPYIDPVVTHLPFRFGVLLY